MAEQAMPYTIVIVGAGQAGVQLAISVRDAGFRGRVVLLGDEAAPPYQRPPLSKAFLLGKLTADNLRFRPPQFYLDNQIEYRAGERVIDVDRSKRSIVLSSGNTLDYDHLVLATGARNRELAIEGAQLDGVVQLRTISDAEDIKARLVAARQLAIIGAGFIGLELAAVASTLKLEARVFELSDRPLARAVTMPTSDFISRMHRSWGNYLHFHAGVQRIVGSHGRVVGVEARGGERFAADLVLVGIGVKPNDELAQRAGLPVGDGILVTDRLQTADPTISAIGDCARFVSGSAGMGLRIESVQNAVEQARLLANNLLGHPAPYRAVPWFWSEQRELKLQMAGLSSGYDATVSLGDPDSQCFSVLCFRERRLVAVESLNQPLEHMLARKLLARAAGLTPADAGAYGFDLKQYERETRL